MATNNKRNALGRGLSALLENAETDVTTGTATRAAGGVTAIPISQIEANPFQPRNEFDKQALEELAQSIKIHGIIQPITVRKVGYDQYQIISGERRTRASILAGLTAIPAYVRIADDQSMLEMALVENIQRENLNAIEVALSYKRLLDECNLKQEELGERVGKERSTVTNYLRLLKLPADIQVGIRDGKLSMGHARAILGIEDADEQMAVYHEIVNQQLSVRKVEELVRESQQRRKNGEAPVASTEPAAAAKIDLGEFKKLPELPV